jgi:hypothetical protein
MLNSLSWQLFFILLKNPASSSFFILIFIGKGDPADSHAGSQALQQGFSGPDTMAV